MLVDTAAFLVTFAFGVFLLTLAASLVFWTERGKAFWLGFASSAFTHFLEISLRIIVGATLVVYSPNMLFPTVFLVFGWMLIGTSAVLALIPWRWHKRFADRSLPPVLKFPKLMAIFSAAIGLFLLFCLIKGPAVN